MNKVNEQVNFLKVMYFPTKVSGISLCTRFLVYVIFVIFF